MEIGIGLPNTLSNPRASTILDFARAADRGGLHSVWSIDRVVLPMVESLTTLAAAAAVTSRVRLGTGVLLGPTRDPLMLGEQVASIDVLSQGRMLLGLGVGNDPREYAATEHDFHTRGRRLDQGIRLLRRLWRGEEVAEGIGPAGIRPVQEHVPILVGGSSAAAMRRVARLGDGYVCVPRGFAYHAETFNRVRTSWKEEGRAGEPMLVAAGYYCVDDSLERARQRVTDYQSHLYGTRPRTSGGTVTEQEFDFAGPPEVIAEALARYSRLGADALMLLPMVDDVGQVEVLAGPVAELYRQATLDRS